MPEDSNGPSRREADRLLGGLDAKFDRLLASQEALLERFDRHAGEGEGTTHSLIARRLNAHASSLNRLKGIGAALVAGAGLVGTVMTWFRTK